MPSAAQGTRASYAPSKVAGLVGLAFLIRLFFLVSTPFDFRQERFGIQGFNDEPSHLNYVRYLVEHKALPVQTRSVRDPDAFVHNDFEYYQPPLYYLIAAPFHAAAESLVAGSGPYATRMVSLLFGVLTVAAAFKAGSAFGPRVGFHCAAILAIFPAHAYFTALGTNDSLAWLMGTLLLVRLLHPPAREGSIPESLKLSCLLAAGLLTKSTLITLAPLLLVRPLLSGMTGHSGHSGRSERDGLSGHSVRRLMPLFPALGAIVFAFVLASPYYVRNLFLYGSLLGMDSGHGTPDGLWHVFTAHRLYECLSWTVVTFWNPMNVSLGFSHPGVQTLIVALTVLTVGLTLLGWRNILRRREPLQSGYAVIAAAALLAAAGYVGYNLIFLQSDARLTFQALTAFLILHALGMEGLRSRKRKGEPVNPAPPH